MELQQKIETYEKLGSANNNQISVELLTQLVHTQKLISENLTSRSNSQVQIVSTNDTANAISLYSGKKFENINDWITEVEHISNHAHWTSSLTLVNAVSRLRGSALNWHKVSGRQLESWSVWKDKITDRFKGKMSFSDFIKFQNKRVLRQDESIVEFIFAKDAIIEKAPFKIEQSDRVSLILEGIIDNTWAIPLTTSMCKSVQELIDHAMPLDTIRKINLTNSTSNYLLNYNGISKEITKPIHRYNPSVDKKEEQMCFKCKTFGHVSYDCTMTSNNSEKSVNNSKYNFNNKNKKPVDKTMHLNKTENSNNKSINCISIKEASDLVKISQIPVTINGSVTIDALPDNGSCATLLRKCFTPADAIIHEWQDGPYATPEGVCTPSGWISLRIQVGKIDYTMPKVGLCDSLPIAMILGRDWQSAVHATIIIEPNGAICINTPSTSQEFGCLKSSKSFIGCVVQSRHTNKPLISKVSTSAKSNDEPNVVSEPFLSNEQEQVLENMLLEYKDIFSTPECELGEFPEFQMEINLTNNRPIKCKPYKASEIDKQFMREQIDKWIESGVCRHSSSPYGAPAFVVEQPHHDSTPKRLVVDYSRTINPFTIKTLFR